MLVIDPGHVYICTALDGLDDQTIRFVKRVGDKYPGNIDAHSGTTLQEVLRACADRLRYVQNQNPCNETNAALLKVRSAILALEQRAARLHGREPFSGTYALDKAEFGTPCIVCGHVGCSPEHHEPGAGA